MNPASSKVRRFLLFAGEEYYPLAGWNTFIDSYESLDKAMEAVGEIDIRPFPPEYVIADDKYEWFEIVDLEVGEPVLQGGHPYGGFRGSKEWLDRKENEEWEKNND